MKEYLRQFMIGRYGQDDLSKLMSISALVAFVISMFVGQVVLYPLALFLLIMCFYRMLSKNTQKRSEENRAYLRLRGRALRWVTSRHNRFRQRKTHCFYKCPSCKINIRVPKGKGNICITCSKCHASFNKKT